MKIIAALVTLVQVSCSASASAGIIISDVTVYALGYSGAANQSLGSIAGASAGTDYGIPVGTGTSSLNFNNQIKSSVSFNFHQNGLNEILDFGWIQSIEGVTDDAAQGIANMSFTTDVDLRYELSGSYAVNGTAAPFQWTFLSDDDNGINLFSSVKQSRSTANETLVVGSPLGGDYSNSVHGSLTGELRAGNHYFLYSFWDITAYSNSTPSDATGNLRFSLSPLNSTAVPEPSSLLLLGMGTIGYFVHGRRARQKRSLSY